MFLRRLVRQPIFAALLRELVPQRLRQPLSRLIIKPPTIDHFRTMVSETTTMEVVPGRVIIVCGSLRPGGAERQVANTLVGLTSSRSPHLESVTLLCDFLRKNARDQYDFYLPLAQKSDATIREIQRRSGDFARDMPAGFRKVKNYLHPNLAADIANLYWEFRALRPQVVHAWLDWSNVRAGLAAVLAGVPRVLLSGRNLSPAHFALNTDYFYPAYRALSEYPPERVKFLNNSRAGANDYAAWLSLPEGRVKVIRNAVHFTSDMRPKRECRTVFRAKLGIPIDAPLVGGMFRFNEEKQPLLWLQTARRVAEACPDAHFVLFGDGDMRKEMDGFIQRAGIGSCVHLCGNVSPSLEGLAPCDLILLTSRGEGTPNVLLEAQWLGLPVVAIDAGGVIEAVKEHSTGRIVRTNDPSIIAEAVLETLKDRKFREAAQTEGPAFISGRYGMRRMIRETLAAYVLDSTIKAPQSEQVLL